MESKSNEIEPAETSALASSSSAAWPRDISCILVVLAGLLIYFQYTTLEKFSSLPPAVRHYMSRAFIEHIAGTISLSLWDGVAAAAILGAFLSLVVLELWKARLSALLDQVFRTERRTMIALTLSILVLIRFYFARGQINWAGDGSSHIFYSWIAATSFALGEIPIWTNYLGTGSPYLQFYGFLFFYLVGFANLLLGDLFSSIKLIMAGSHLLSGIGMYAFVRCLCDSRRAGFIAGLAFVLCMWHTQQSLIMGRLPLSVFYGLIPWPFYFLETLKTRKNSPYPVIAGASALALLAFTHPGYGFWATFFFGLYALVRILLLRTKLPAGPIAIRAFLMLFTGLVLGAYLTLSMWIERAHVNLEEISHADVPDPTWNQLLIWSNYRVQLADLPNSDHWYGGYLGISLVAIASFALFGIVRRRYRFFSQSSLAAGSCFLVSLILVVGYRWPIINDLGIVRAFNSGRYLLFVTFFLSVLVGCGSSYLTLILHKNPKRVFSLLLLILLGDLGPTTFQHPYFPRNTMPVYIPSAKESLHNEILRLPEGQLPGFRLFFSTNHIFSLLATAWFPYITGIPSFLSGYREGPLAVHKFTLPLQNEFDGLFKDVDNPEHVPAIRNVQVSSGLFLLNTRFNTVMVPQTEQQIDWTWPSTSPVMVTSKIESLPDHLNPPGENLEAFMGAMKIQPATYSCAKLFVDGFTEDLGGSPRVEVISHKVWNQRVELRIQTSVSCFARLSYAHYPFLGVTVNGQHATTYRTSEGFIALKLPVGEHQIELEPFLSPLWRSLLYLDLFLLLVFAFVLTRRKPGFRLFFSRPSS